MNMFEKLWETNQLAMKNVLEGDTAEENTKENTNSSLAKSKAEDYYLSCMDPSGTIDSLECKTVIAIIEKSLN